MVTIHFNEAVTGFGPDDLTATGGTLILTFQQIDADTYTATFSAHPNFEGTGQVTLTGAYTDLAGNPGVTGATDTVERQYTSQHSRRDHTHHRHQRRGADGELDLR